MASGSSNTILCSANASIKKHHGKLTLTPRSLDWNPTSAGHPDGAVHIDAKAIDALFSSKEGSQKVMLKVKHGPSDSDSHNFIFSSASSALSDREAFKRELSQIIARNRARQQSATPDPSPSTPAASAEQSEIKQSTSKTSSSSKPAKASTSKHGAAPEDWKVRSQALKKNKDLAELYQELVMGNQISEDEFWEGREHIIEEEKLLQQQQPGRPAQLVDPQPETNESGEIKIRITPQLVSDIFEQYPIVGKIYNENVPNELNETAFWTRYFRSKLFKRHRSSARMLGEGLKDDPLFDKYLDEQDDDLEPKNLRSEHVDALLDLAATSEDHLETGNQQDFSMRAGAQRTSLPLIRRFNDYSERLLDKTTGSEKRQKLGIDSGDANSRRYYDQIELGDLMDEEREDRILLNVNNQDGFRGRGTDGETNDRGEDVKAILHNVSRDWENYHPTLGEFSVDGDSVDKATTKMYDFLKARQATAKSTKSTPMPDDVMRQVVSCQAAANEFLRHFWSAVLPTRSDDITPAAKATPKEKAAKAERMIGYLKKTNERVKLVSQSAANRGVDSERVEQALQPMLDAVAKATTFFNQRIGIS